MSLEDVEPHSTEIEVIIECDACGDQRTLTFEPTEDDLKEMTKDHQFMCTGDFGFYEVESKEETELYSRKQLEQVSDEAEGDTQ